MSDLDHSTERSGKSPEAAVAGSGSLFVRTVRSVSERFGCSAESAQRYMDLRDEGHPVHQAALMAGIADPRDNA